MVEYIIALVLLVIALLAISLRKTYSFFPVRELKRQARSGDHDAAVLYRAVAYGGSLRLLLWLIIGVAVAASFVMLTMTDVIPAWLAGVLVALVIWYAFAWAPSSRVTRVGIRIAVILTPLISWKLYYINRPLDWVVRTTERHRHVTFHTGLFERADLIDLLAEQRSLPDNRITHAELDIVLHALSFGEKSAASIMVPGRYVKTVKETDALGPILMDELYDSEFSRFPVVTADGQTIVGTLYLRDLVASRQGGLVSDVMKPTVFYVHETQTLYQVLHAFLTTKHQLFVVINSDEQYVGIITIEDVLEQIIGHKIEDDFDSYDDRRAVAEYPNRANNTAGQAEAVEIPDPEAVIEPSDSDETEITIPRD